MAIKDNLIAYWDFASNSTDQTGNGHSGTDTSISYAASDAAFTSGGSSKITFVNSAAMNPTGAYSVNGWWKHSTSATNPVFFQVYSQNTNVAGFFMYVETLKFSWYHGKNTGTVANTDYKDLLGITDPGDGAYHMWTCTWDGTTMSIYKDGSATPESTAVPGFNAAYAATSYPTVGAFSQSGTYSNFANTNNKLYGFWSRALSTSEIATLYNAGSGLTYAQLPGGAAALSTRKTLLGVGI